MITSLRLKYTGAGTRLLGAFVWSKDNGYTCTVDDAGVAANLLTYPHPSFVIAPDEPLLATMTIEQITMALIDQVTTISADDDAAAASKPKRSRRKPIED